jgi:CRISPR/Cas system Type II protein with McrA/HNH and RuvC-like nuclease domain
MAGIRGLQHRPRTVYPPDKAVRAVVVLHPEDEERKLYEELVSELGVSGAEVLREALRELHKRETRRKERRARQEAKLSGQAPQEELPQAG